VSIPSDYQYTKGRTWQYEVVKEIPRDQIDDLLDRGTDIDDYRVAVYSIANDRKKLLAEVLALPLVKKMLRQAKKARRVKRGRKSKDAAFIVSEKSIRKMTIGRLAALYSMYAPPTPATVSQGAFIDPATGYNRLFVLRKSYGFSRGQVADKMKLSYGTVANYEKARSLPQATIDDYMDAVMRLTRLGATDETGLSLPKPTQKRRAAAAGAASSYEDKADADFVEDEESMGDEFGYGYTDESDYEEV
jgi:transcriptional regulator with XRE-family HTH domain